MTGTYDPLLVVLSVIIATFASYTTFSLVSRISGSTGKVRLMWLSGGACSMGIGIWSMHFIGMLSFRFPVLVTYSIPITLLSLLIAIMTSGFALDIVSRKKLGVKTLVMSGLFMGFGIASMHYTGMFAMNMPMSIRYDPYLFALSVLIAITASMVALRIVFDLRGGDSLSVQWKKAIGAVVMGFAIAGMHYTGMAAAKFPVSMGRAPVSTVGNSWLAITIALASFMILVITLILSLIDSHLHLRTKGLVHSLTNANERLHHMALHDGLTKLPNRTLLEDRIEQSIRHASMEAGSFPVLFLDLDRFKPINDYMGHHLGDELLKQVATRLLETLNPDDTVARIGGDEFVIVLHNTKDPQRVHEVAQRVKNVISRTFTINGQSLTISVSVGISMYPHDGTSFQALLVNADSAMYYAKKKGPGIVQFFSPEMESRTSLRIEMENDLRSALENKEFVLHYQPKVTIGTGFIESVEALVRWNHPKRGLLYPKDFIPLAEETGLIVPLGEWVLREACKENAAWQKAGLPRLRLAVNMSALQFLHQDLESIVFGALKEVDLEADCLEIEITETLLMQDPEGSMQTLAAIRAKGVHVSIDDFGTGYSSLAYLKKFPLDKLKIDKSFITEIATNASDSAIVRTIITLAHSLELQVIAEGVETVDQLKILRDMGCDVYQGFYLTPPLPPELFVEILKNEGKML
ncbi:MAG: EAL domain-containing protein [Leptospirales bacterium]